MTISLRAEYTRNGCFDLHLQSLIFFTVVWMDELARRRGLLWLVTVESNTVVAKCGPARNSDRSASAPKVLFGGHRHTHCRHHQLA